MESDHAYPPNTSTGVAYWPDAAPYRVKPPSLAETLEAEFNIAQMRALAKTWNIKLKGSSRSGFVEQVVQVLSERVAQMRTEPDALLEGLTPEQAGFVRRLLTARDYELPFPRSLAGALWAASGAPGKPPERSLAEMFDALRRRALVFPTHRYVGYRDVYYQWLPLAASGGNVPVVKWEIGDWGVEIAPSAAVPNFLDAFDLFLNAVLSTGVDVRPSLPAHPRAANSFWLQRWEYEVDEADRLLNSRPGWAPDPRSGIGVPLRSWLPPSAKVQLESQTGLPQAQCEFLFTIAAALQLIEAPDPFAAAADANFNRRAAPGYRLETSWHLNARRSAVEEWYALTGEQRLLKAWLAWQDKLADGVEVAHALSPDVCVMRAIGARELGPLDLAAEWCALRRYVVRALRGLPVGRRVDWPEFRQKLFEFYPDCAWALFSQDHWWFTERGSARRLNMGQREDWERSIGVVIETTLGESLRWFGVIEAEEDEKPDAGVGARGVRRLAAFRVTELGDWLWQAEAVHRADCGAPLPRLPERAWPQPRPAEPIAWLDERSWRLPPAPDRAEFISFARAIGRPTDVSFVYTLTPASIESALQAGVTLEEVCRQFERFGAPMPLPAQQLFRSIAERFGRIRVYEALTVLQFSDDYVLPELMANMPLGEAIVYPLSPRAVVVRPEAVDALMRVMIERGYTPTERR